MVAKACEILRVYENMNDMKAFWEKFGRPDLFGLTRAHLVGQPVLQEILGIAERVTRERIFHEKKIEGLGLMSIQAFPRRRLPKPLTRFLIDEGARMFYYWRHPTKGWRCQSIDRSQFKLERKAGAKVLPALPHDIHFRRTR